MSHTVNSSWPWALYWQLGWEADEHFQNLIHSRPNDLLVGINIGWRIIRRRTVHLVDRKKVALLSRHYRASNACSATGRGSQILHGNIADKVFLIIAQHNCYLIHIPFHKIPSKCTENIKRKYTQYELVQLTMGVSIFVKSSKVLLRNKSPDILKWPPYKLEIQLRFRWLTFLSVLSWNACS